MLISTKGKALIGQFASGDEDLIVFTSTNFSNPAGGTWTMYFDGSDVDLTTSDEDVTGVCVDDVTGEVYITTNGLYELVHLLVMLQTLLFFLLSALFLGQAVNLRANNTLMGQHLLLKLAWLMA